MDKKNVKICITTPSLSEKVGMGISRYAYNLITNIARIDKSIKFDITERLKSGTGSKTEKKITPKIPRIIKKAMIPLLNEGLFLKRFIWNVYLLKKRIKKKNYDIYHAMSPEESVALISLHKTPVITTFHDLIPLIYKDRRSLLEKIYFKYYCRIAKKSNVIIANSEYTKKDLITILKIPEDKIEVIPLGIDTKKFYPKRKKTRKIKKILYLGGLIKRKGVYEVIYAFSKLLNIRKDVRLLICGGGKEYENIKKEIFRLGIGKYVQLSGFINEDELCSYYHKSDLFVYPSKYEGFGFTPLEAMACGIPVITSDRSSIPEVVGESAIKINPSDINNMCDKMNMVLSDKNLQNTMRINGLKQVKKFTWERCAKKTLELYRSIR